MATRCAVAIKSRSIHAIASLLLLATPLLAQSNGATDNGKHHDYDPKGPSKPIGRQDDDADENRSLRRSVDSPGVITTRQAITPAGIQAILNEGEHAYEVRFGSDGTIWGITGRGLVNFDWQKNAILSRHDFPLVGGASPVPTFVFNRDKSKIAFAEIGMAEGEGFTIKAGAVHLQVSDAAGKFHPIGGALGTNAVGTPCWSGDNILLPLLFDDKLAIVHSVDGNTKLIKVGIAPLAVVVNDDLAFVANFGGKVPATGEPAAQAGNDKAAEMVRIDNRGIAKPGSITVIDLATNTPKTTIPVGRHPSALALDTIHQRLYVANTNDDSISVIDAVHLTLLKTISLKPFAGNTYGIAPTALALDEKQQHLYIALGGLNAVAVYNLTKARIDGLIPTGWYPIAVDLDEVHHRLAIATLMGVGSGFLTPKLAIEFEDNTLKDLAAYNPAASAHKYVHAVRGTLQVVPIPDEAQLSRYTAAVADDNHLLARAPALPASPAMAVRKAVPLRAGDPSLINHVVYIVKENQSYDTLFGDLTRGNGAPDLLLYDDTIIPNHRELAREFVLLDNFYVNGTMSENGHQWLTQANETSYTMAPHNSGRSYPFDGSDPLAYSAHGFLWDSALARGRSVAVFGEYAPTAQENDTHRIELINRWRAGETFHHLWHTRSPIPPLDRVLVRDYPSWNLGIPDVIRAQRFLEELKSYESRNNMPALTIVELPSDHTYGIDPGKSSPNSMMADNDLALGMIVEELTKSKFWPTMAIYVVEDDAQNGVDHVDGHRSPALLISPYTRRKTTDSTFYSFTSVLKTIELQLGLPPLTLFDSIANDMRASFSDTRDLTPYASLTPKQDLLELIPPLAQLQGPRKEAAVASIAVDWSLPDAAPPAWISEVLWREARGWNTPIPETANALFAPYAPPGDDDNGK